MALAQGNGYMATRLSVNVNKIALLRNQRDLRYPDVLQVAQVCLSSGAKGITAHPRPDERHIRFSDLEPLRRLVALRQDCEFNIEGNPDSERWMDSVLRLKPHQATLVPDSPDQGTSDHGYKPTDAKDRIGAYIMRLKDAGIRVSVFVDVEDFADYSLLAALGVDRVELYTEPYASAFLKGAGLPVLSRFQEAAKAAAGCGLEVNAGHDLTGDNLPAFISAVRPLHEVSIGHWIAATALFDGMARVVTHLSFLIKEHEAASVRSAPRVA